MSGCCHLKSLQFTQKWAVTSTWADRQACCVPAASTVCLWVPHICAIDILFATMLLCHGVAALHLQAKAGSGLVEGYSSVDDLIEQADGFAEVFPEHKYEIVKMLQVLTGSDD
jgi:hypothetical protein